MFTDDEQQNSTVRHARALSSKRAMWALLIVGVLLVCLADRIGALFAQSGSVSLFQGTPGITFTSANPEFILTLRILGIMIFVAGLVERVVVALKTHPSGY